MNYPHSGDQLYGPYQNDSAYWQYGAGARANGAQHSSTSTWDSSEEEFASNHISRPFPSRNMGQAQHDTYGQHRNTQQPVSASTSRSQEYVQFSTQTLSSLKFITHSLLLGHCPLYVDTWQRNIELDAELKAERHVNLALQGQLSTAPIPSASAVPAHAAIPQATPFPPPTKPLRPLDPKEYPSCRFWYKRDFDAYLSRKNAGNTSAGSLDFLEDENGQPLDESIKSKISQFIKGIFSDLFYYRRDPKTWASGANPAEVKLWGYVAIEKEFLCFRLGEGHWKAEAYFINQYPAWNRYHRGAPNSGLKRQFPSINNSQPNPSKRVKTDKPRKKKVAKKPVASEDGDEGDMDINFQSFGDSQNAPIVIRSPHPRFATPLEPLELPKTSSVPPTPIATADKGITFSVPPSSTTTTVDSAPASVTIAGSVLSIITTADSAPASITSTPASADSAPTFADPTPTSADSAPIFANSTPASAWSAPASLASTDSTPASAGSAPSSTTSSAPIIISNSSSMPDPESVLSSASTSQDSRPSAGILAAASVRPSDTSSQAPQSRPCPRAKLRTRQTDAPTQLSSTIPLASTSSGVPTTLSTPSTSTTSSDTQDTLATSKETSKAPAKTKGKASAVKAKKKLVPKLPNEHGGMSARNLWYRDLNAKTGVLYDADELKEKWSKLSLTLNKYWNTQSKKVKVEQMDATVPGDSAPEED
ncbi:hypothetical protein VKT23_013632 [Stygiomarasmius scandens]|uniref:Uncharacterized protein n=1 Tax=Marasmiellus scandens TaxID=2682957 RepID=A0ABR1J2Z1_9AGAR